MLQHEQIIFIFLPSLVRWHLGSVLQMANELIIEILPKIPFRFYEFYQGTLFYMV